MEDECPGGCTESTVNTTTESFAPLNASFLVADPDDPLGGDEPAEGVEPFADPSPTRSAPAMMHALPSVASTESTVPPSAALARTTAPSTTIAPTPTAPAPTTVAPTTTAPAPPTTESGTAAVAGSSATPTTQVVDTACSIGFSVALGAMTDPALTAIAQINRAMSNIELVSGTDVSITFGGEWPTDSAPLGWTSGDGSQILINPDHPYANEPSVILEIVTHELGHIFIGPQHVSDGSILDPQLNGQVMFSESDRATLSTITCADLGYG